MKSYAADEPSEGPSLLDAVLRYWWLVVACAALGALAGWGYSARQTPLYEATATLLLTDPATEGVFVENRVYSDPRRYVANQAARIESRSVATVAAERLGGELTAEQVMRRVDAEESRDLDLIILRARDTDPGRAARLANAVATAYDEVAAQQVRSNAEAATEELREAEAELEEQIARLDQQLQETPDNGAAQAQRTAAATRLSTLQARADQIIVDASLYGSGVQQFDPALAPTAPVLPRTTRNVAVGGGLGLLAALAGAWWLTARRMTADRSRDPAGLLETPLLGSVPNFRSLGIRDDLPVANHPNSAAAEAYQLVVAALGAELGQGSGKVVLVTSPRPGDGKTVTALNVAVAAANETRRVLLVDADVHLKGLSRMCGTEHSLGLSDMERLVREPPLQVLRGTAGGQPVNFLGAGSWSGNFATFFRTPAFRETMEWLRAQADLVVLDSPPLLSVADTSAIAAHVDGIVLVVPEGTPLDILREVRSRLEFVGAPLLGYVFNRASVRHSAQAYYAYGGRRGLRRRSPRLTLKARERLLDSRPQERQPTRTR